MGHPGTKDDDSGLLRRGTAALPELARATPAPDASHVYGVYTSAFLPYVRRPL